MSFSPESFKTVSLSKREMYCIRMLEAGEADSEAQRIALSAILKKLCRAYDCHFIPTSDRETVFLEGRGFVGQQILKILRLDPNALNALKEENSNGR